MKGLVNLALVALCSISCACPPNPPEPDITIHDVFPERNALTEITSSKNFRDFVYNSELPVIIDFYSPSCAPCVHSESVLEELTTEFKGKINFGKINIEEHPTVWKNQDIESWPTIILYQQGKERIRIIGYWGPDETKRKIRQAYNELK